MRNAFSSLRMSLSILVKRLLDVHKETLDNLWERLIEGYSKIIASKKDRGIMSVTKGRSRYFFSDVESLRSHLFLLQANLSLVMLGIS